MICLKWLLSSRGDENSKSLIHIGARAIGIIIGSFDARKVVESRGGRQSLPKDFVSSIRKEVFPWISSGLGDAISNESISDDDCIGLRIALLSIATRSLGQSCLKWPEGQESLHRAFLPQIQVRLI